MSATELRVLAQSLERTATVQQDGAWGLCHLGPMLGRTELDELVSEAASDHALHMHEYGVEAPSRDAADGQPAIHPLLIFDSCFATACPNSA